jgi:hypothetical protein
VARAPTWAGHERTHASSDRFVVVWGRSVEVDVTTGARGVQSRSWGRSPRMHARDSTSTGDGGSKRNSPGRDETRAAFPRAMGRKGDGLSCLGRSDNRRHDVSPLTFVVRADDCQGVPNTEVIDLLFADVDGDGRGFAVVAAETGEATPAVSGPVPPGHRTVTDGVVAPGHAVHSAVGHGA